MASTKTNFAWNLVLTASNYIFPLITFPYVSRVLGVSNIGVCNYVDSIINYFILFSMLGVGSLGVREISKVKDDKKKLEEVYSSLTFVLLVTTLVAVAVLVILTYTVDLFEPYKAFLLVGILKLVFSSLNQSWLYQGLSIFKFVTIRSVVVRLFYVVAVFIFVRGSDDSLIYYFLTCMMLVLNTLINWKYSFKLVTFNLKSINTRIYMSGILSYGFYLILNSMYTGFNVFYLGSVTNDVEVGYYTTATKIYGILMSVFSAFTSVMVPKISELVSKREYEYLRSIAKETFSLIFIFSIPIIIVSYFYSNVIINIIAGSGYEGAVLPFKIVMVLLLVVALEQIIIQQFLMAITESKCIVVLSSVGATVGITMNLVLASRLMSVGSAITWMSSEICILLVSLFFFKKYFKMTLPFGELGKYLLFSIPYILFCYIFQSDSFSIKVLIGISLCFCWFLIENMFIIKNKFIIDLASKLVRK